MTAARHRTRILTALAIFAGSALLLFGVSALYHRFYWGPRMNAVLRAYVEAKQA